MDQSKMGNSSHGKAVAADQPNTSVSAGAKDSKTLITKGCPSFQVVQQLSNLLDADEKMKETLLLSLDMAVTKAKQHLNKELYLAINFVFHNNGWPTTVNNYLKYLDLYARLIPDSADGATLSGGTTKYPDAWKTTATENGYNKKVYDLLCHLHWLVDQKVAGGRTLQDFPTFANWLVDFATSCGSFLDTTESLSTATLNSFEINPMYNCPLFNDEKKSWKTFNDFFCREFNCAEKVTGITPIRPIAEPANNNTIVAPADCTYKMVYAIDDLGNVLDGNGDKTTVCFKGTHTIGTIDGLLQGSEYAKFFHGGTFVHYFLSPFEYHRFHTPIHGKLLDLKAIAGKAYLHVDIKGGQWDAPDGAVDGYEFVQSRGLIIVDGGPKVGKVATLPIGMSQVDGVHMFTDKLHIGQHVVKGQEFGKFQFGGSDIILLFEKNPELYLFKTDPGHNPIHFQYGQAVAYWNIPQVTPGSKDDGHGHDDSDDHGDAAAAAAAAPTETQPPTPDVTAVVE